MKLTMTVLRNSDSRCLMLMHLRHDCILRTINRWCHRLSLLLALSNLIYWKLAGDRILATAMVTALKLLLKWGQACWVLANLFWPMFSYSHKIMIQNSKKPWNCAPCNFLNPTNFVGCVCVCLCVFNLELSSLVCQPVLVRCSLDSKNYRVHSFRGFLSPQQQLNMVLFI